MILKDWLEKDGDYRCEIDIAEDTSTGQNYIFGRIGIAKNVLVIWTLKDIPIPIDIISREEVSGTCRLNDASEKDERDDRLWYSWCYAPISMADDITWIEDDLKHTVKWFNLTEEQ